MLRKISTENVYRFLKLFRTYALNMGDMNITTKVGSFGGALVKALFTPMMGTRPCSHIINKVDSRNWMKNLAESENTPPI